MKSFIFSELLRIVLYALLSCICYLGLLPGNSILFVISYFFMIGAAFYAVLLFFNILRIVLLYLIKKKYAVLTLFYYFINQKNHARAWEFCQCTGSSSVPDMRFFKLDSNTVYNMAEFEAFTKYWQQLTGSPDFNYIDLVEAVPVPGSENRVKGVVRILKGGYRNLSRKWFVRQLMQALSVFFIKKQKPCYYSKFFSFVKDENNQLKLREANLDYENASQNYRELAD
ncbi:MAG TPA: hypothetical protein VKS21_04355 [Spirochaetota bacterium]|nr:hypothetical protein [Spirochaetota bacterium]